MNAQDLEKEILRIAKDGKTEVVDLPEYWAYDDQGFDVRLDLEDAIKRFKKENPDAQIHNEFELGEVFATRPISPHPSWATLYIAVDHVGQRYGGPEEGGWWYDVGYVEEFEPIRVHFKEDRTPYLKDGEREFLGKLAEKWAQDYEFGTHHRSSSRPRGNDYDWRVTWDVPKDWPERRPYYE